MSDEKRKTRKGARFQVLGKVNLEKCDSPPGDLELQAYAFNERGQFIGGGSVDDEGGFEILVEMEKAAPVKLFLGPPSDPDNLDKTAAYSRMYTAEDWVLEGDVYRLNPDIYLAEPIWRFWRPLRICISGHVRKLTDDGACPVPYVKVEVFDVDREACWWPYILRWYDKLKFERVFRIPDIIIERPPIPDPIGPVIDPGPIKGPRPLPDPIDFAGISPQPAPPNMPMMMSKPSEPAPAMAVGEMRTASYAVAESLQDLVLTSKIAPWYYLPLCFYSKAEVCETYTDCNGYFRCCFDWSLFHFRRGRLRFDARPDIILRVTQVIDGVETVVYLDPYTSTRWDMTSAHIDLYLDNEEVRCGSPLCDDPVAIGSEVFFTRVGYHDVYKIHQGTGLYPNPAAPGVPAYSNVAYGHQLKLHAAFGDNLADGSPKRYYRLSYARQAVAGVTPPDADFKPIKLPSAGLVDTRVEKGTLLSSTYNLGPQTVGTQQGLYEVRDTVNYHWYHQGDIGDWLSWLDEPDSDRYVLRLEVFDETGNKLTTASGQVDYRDGTHIPTMPATPLPAMTDHCDLVILLDNDRALATLTTPATNACGVVPWTPGLSLDFGVHVAQGNGRIRSWQLYYTKGTDSTPHVLGGSTSNNGLPDPVSTTIHVPNSNAMISGLTSTCAFAVKLWCRAHVTNGVTAFIFYDEDLQAIAIEKCS